MPLRTPELSLTSRNTSDIQVSWQPLPDKLSRGRVSAYRLSYRTATVPDVTAVDLPRNTTEHRLEDLEPDTIYLLRIAVATRVGWCEPTAWTSHRTPRVSSSKGNQWQNRTGSTAHTYIYTYIYAYIYIYAQYIGDPLYTHQKGRFY